MNGLDPLKSVWFNMPHNLSLLRNVPTSLGMSLEPRKAYLFLRKYIQSQEGSPDLQVFGFPKPYKPYKP